MAYLVGLIPFPERDNHHPKIVVLGPETVFIARFHDVLIMGCRMI
jgi:hypothetical protein